MAVAWDEQIPEGCHEAWRNWLQILGTLHTIQIPRWYCAGSNKTHLYIFSDAGEKCMAAVANAAFPGGKVTLKVAKLEVAPLKINRLSV